MLQKHLIFTAILSMVIVITSGTPVAYPRIYNPQTFVSPNDINDLEQDHVKRALSDVAVTIKEVQKLLETDRTLPRLTRGEIEELFENVTKEEYEKSLRQGDRDRAKHMRALMLVLPYNTNNNSDLQELYTRPPVTRVVKDGAKTQKLQTIVVQPEDVDPKSSVTNATTYKPTLEIRRPPSTPRPTTFHPKSPIVQKPVARTSNTITTSTTTTVSIPTATSILPPYTADRPPAPFKTQPIIRENVKDLLATIGLTQELVPTTTPKPEMTQELKQLLQSFGLLTNEEPPKHVGTIETIQEEFDPIPSSLIRHEPTYVNEFQPLPLPKYRMNPGPEMTPFDYQSFKPLPIPEESPVDGDMEKFLKSFGLFDGNARGKKSLHMENDESEQYPLDMFGATVKPKYVKMEKMPEVSVDFLAPDLISVLDNIGVTSVKANREKSSYDRGLVKYDLTMADNTIRRSSEHVDDETFIDNASKKNQPTENVTMRMANSQAITDEDFGKLQQLLETIKKLDKLNASLTDEEIESLSLNNFNLSESLLAHGPDPNDHAEFDEKKNEVKRQSEETTDSPNPLRFTLDLQATTEEFNGKGDFLNLTSVATTSTPAETTVAAKTSTTTTTTSTEEPRRNGLEDSFGSLDPVTEEPLPPPRRNGFYFLADWNSFLEVGEDPDKVIVRFDPKIGDPSRFLKVTVP